MSGGHFDYTNDSACEEVFSVYPDYGMGGHEYLIRADQARRKNPMESYTLSELVYDVFCLLHSLDWYKSGDNCEEIYLKDVAYFIRKWLSGGDAIVKRSIDMSIMNLKDDLYKSLGLEVASESN